MDEIKPKIGRFIPWWRPYLWVTLQPPLMLLSTCAFPAVQWQDYLRRERVINPGWRYWVAVYSEEMWRLIRKEGYNIMQLTKSGYIMLRYKHAFHEIGSSVTTLSHYYSQIHLFRGFKMPELRCRLTVSICCQFNIWCRHSVTFSSYSLSDYFQSHVSLLWRSFNVSLCLFNCHTANNPLLRCCQSSDIPSSFSLKCLAWCHQFNPVQFNFMALWVPTHSHVISRHFT